jgi:hypothetical protein
MSPVGFELIISAGERSQTYPSDRVTTGNCHSVHRRDQNSPPLVLILSQINLLNARSMSFTINVYFVLPSAGGYLGILALLQFA